MSELTINEFLEAKRVAASQIGNATQQAIEEFTRKTSIPITGISINIISGITIGGATYPTFIGEIDIQTRLDPL